MTPLEFLNVEYENVKLALRETLRHDYAPTQSEDYFRECEIRLANIHSNFRHLTEADALEIHGLLSELTSVATFTTLIERARLGEFSWPFADEIRRVAKILFAESLPGPEPGSQRIVEPIIHVMSEGEGYKIFYEQVLDTSSERRFLVVAFPRPLKHSVLMHTLFGHELGHTAVAATTTAKILNNKVNAAMLASSPLKDLSSMNEWLKRDSAPNSVKRELQGYQDLTGVEFSFTEDNRKKWQIELICDAFGLVLLGPAFLAAHHAYLLPLEPDLYEINADDSTHPPFAIRHKMLIQLMRALNWQAVIPESENQEFHNAEKSLLDPLLDDQYDDWATFFTEREISEIVTELKNLFAKDESLAYAPPAPSELSEMIKQLIKGCPPVIAKVVDEKTVDLKNVRIASTLYAGWVYWAGREKLKLQKGFVELTFLEVNKLCDYSLLQQRAINLFIPPDTP